MKYPTRSVLVTQWFSHQKCHTFEPKPWEFWVVTMALTTSKSQGCECQAEYMVLQYILFALLDVYTRLSNLTDIQFQTFLVM